MGLHGIAYTGPGIHGTGRCCLYGIRPPWYSSGRDAATTGLNGIVLRDQATAGLLGRDAATAGQAVLPQQSSRQVLTITGGPSGAAGPTPTDSWPAAGAAASLAAGAATSLAASSSMSILCRTPLVRAVCVSSLGSLSAYLAVYRPKKRVYLVFSGVVLGGEGGSYGWH